MSNSAFWLPPPPPPESLDEDSLEKITVLDNDLTVQTANVVTGYTLLDAVGDMLLPGDIVCASWVRYDSSPQTFIISE